MSWRGVKKSISRLPHQFKTRNGGEDVTKDMEYLELEKKYKSVVKNGDEFRLEVMTYRDNLANLLNYQSLVSTHIAELCGLTVDSSEDTQGYTEIRPEVKQALEDFATAMAYCKEESFAHLDDLDALVLQPLDHFQTITKTINKTIIKRDHKLIDYDRFRNAYYKYSAISDPSPSEEKNMFKLQTQYENAAHDYEYFNNMLKDDLAVFLDLAQQLIQPIIENFYNIQSRTMGGIYGRLHELIEHNSACFPTLNLSIEEGFELRISQRNVRQELESLDIFSSGSKLLERRGSSFSGTQRRPSYAYDGQSDNDDSLYAKSPEQGQFRRSSSSISSQDRFTPSLDSGKPTAPPLSTRPAFLNNRARSLSSPNTPPPIRRPSYTPSLQSSLSTMTSHAPPPVRASYTRRNTVSNTTPPTMMDTKEVAKKKRAPPPPPPSKKYTSSKREYVEALYALNGPQQGDLSFSAGDLIEVLEKSDKTEDWWKGRIGDQVGMFPANYVKSV